VDQTPDSVGRHPDLVLKMIRPKQLGQALRRSFAFCDMDP
jgi:hypothetical protein